MSCFSDQHFVVDSSDEVCINVSAGIVSYSGHTTERVRIKHGHAGLTVSGETGIARALLEKLAAAIAAVDEELRCEHVAQQSAEVTQ